MTHTEFKKRFLPLQQMLYKEAYRILCDKFEAEDAVQNLYLRLWQEKDKLATLQTPEAYARTMLHNICIDRWRLLREEKKNEDVSTLQVVSEHKNAFEVEDEREYINLYLKELPPLQRKVVQLRMSGLGYEEIERITGLSAVNIRVIISRLRKKFREYYNKR